MEHILICKREEGEQKTAFKNLAIRYELEVITYGLVTAPFTNLPSVHEQIPQRIGIQWNIIQIDFCLIQSPYINENIRQALTHMLKNCVKYWKRAVTYTTLFLVWVVLRIWLTDQKFSNLSPAKLPLSGLLEHLNLLAPGALCHGRS